MTRDQRRAVMAALLGYSNMGQPVTGPRADRQTVSSIQWILKHPSTDARMNIINLCGHLIENDEQQKCWEKEARHWSGQLRKMTDAAIQKAWPDIWGLTQGGNDVRQNKSRSGREVPANQDPAAEGHP